MANDRMSTPGNLAAAAAVPKRAPKKAVKNGATVTPAATVADAALPRPAVKQEGSSGSGGSSGSRDWVGSGSSKWLAADGSKRWAELFFLCYSPVWITWALCIIVPFGFYHSFRELEYMYVGLAAGLPCVLLPPLLQGKADTGLPWHQQFWVKANIWIAIFSFVGNYFWTHYFFTLLGASYTFPSWRLNNVPIPLYLLTHAYFCFYHTISNLTMRRLSNAMRELVPGSGTASQCVRGAAMTGWVVALAYVTAFMETLTIAHFDYYTFVDKAAMYSVGSLFYAIYFFISFPLFYRIEEDPCEPKWSLGRTALDSLGAAMLVTVLLDFWRLAIGPIVPVQRLAQAAAATSGGSCVSMGVNAMHVGLAWA